MVMKIENLVKIPEEDKKLAVEFFRKMNDGKGILVVNSLGSKQEYSSVDSLVELYSKDNLYIGSVTEFHQNRYMKAGRKELIIEKYARPNQNDLVVVESGSELYAKRFRELEEKEKKMVIGIVLEECIWIGEN